MRRCIGENFNKNEGYNLCDAVVGREGYQKNSDDLEMLKKVEKLKSDVFILPVS